MGKEDNLTIRVGREEKQKYDDLRKKYFGESITLTAFTGLCLELGFIVQQKSLEKMADIQAKEMKTLVNELFTKYIAENDTTSIDTDGIRPSTNTRSKEKLEYLDTHTENQNSGS